MAAMNREPILRRALAAAAVFNLGAAVAFAWPASLAGRLAGLPESVPALYRAVAAMFILLFGLAYAWLARRPVIDSTLVVFGAVGKAIASAVFALLWLGGAASGRLAALGAGDLVLAALFLWCLAGAARRDPRARLL
jgi:hypothetical protein